MIGSYAYTDAEDIKDKDPTLQGQPPAKRGQATPARCRRRMTSAALLVAINCGWCTVRATSASARATPPNDFDLPGYTVADAFATYDTKLDGQKVKFQLNVKNLFDRTYYTSAASRLFVSIGDARQVSVSSTLEF